MEWLLLVGRVLYGGYFVMGGIMHFMKMRDMTEMTRQKGVPSPSLAVGASGILIVLAGLGVILGIYPDLSLLILAAFIIVVTPVMHAFWRIEDPMMSMMDMQMFMKNMALLGAALALYALSSDWPLSISL